LLRALVLKILRKFIPMPMPQSVRIPSSSPQKKRRTGKPNLSNIKSTNSLSSNARLVLQPRSRISRLVVARRRKSRCTFLLLLVIFQNMNAYGTGLLSLFFIQTT